MEGELRPVIDPDEPRRRRAYRLSLTLSLVIIGGGALYFLFQEIISFTKLVPQEFATPEVQRAVDEFKEVGL